MSGLQRMAPRLLAHWDHVAARIHSSPRVAVFLDFDGTLVRIARRPDQVHLATSTRRVLRRLGHHPRVTVVVISGRRRAELLGHIGLRGVGYFGLYGWERGRHSPLPASARIALRRVRRQLSIRLSKIPGIWIEDKHLSLSVHLLNVSPPRQRWARREVRSVLRPFRETLHVFENLRDSEVVPRSIPSKGVAVRQFLAKPALCHALPFYFGDDLSDEPAFAAVHKGISICVGAARPTRARYSIRGPAEVAAVLTKLEAALP
ncbi:MAG TPA: trehalose-phosphatase [Candidatus Dormibacteraeota bacterium]|nr:trehalose-phosphatase [Candidatus Dormibacteraeota bacterium]